MALAESDMAGWLVAAGTMAGAIAIAIVTLLKGRSDAAIKSSNAKARRLAQFRKDAAAQWQVIATQYEEQLDRASAVIKQHQEVIQSLMDDHASCREEAAELRSAVYFLYDHLKRVHAIAMLDSQQHDPGPLPELPPMRQRGDPGRSEFLIRQAAHAASLLGKAGAAIKAPGQEKGHENPGG